MRLDKNDGSQAKIEALLRAIEGVCTLYLEDSQPLDSNIMIPIAADDSIRRSFWENANAHKAFDDSLVKRASSILRVHATTNQIHNGFLVPILTEATDHMPGAAEAYCTMQPQVVFTIHLRAQRFGSGISADHAEKVMGYLRNVPFEVFFSFPVIRESSAVAIVNMNVPQDEIKFYSREELLELYYTLMPFLAAVEMSLSTITTSAKQALLLESGSQ